MALAAEVCSLSFTTAVAWHLQKREIALKKPLMRMNYILAVDILLCLPSQEETYYLSEGLKCFLESSLQCWNQCADKPDTVFIMALCSALRTAPKWEGKSSLPKRTICEKTNWWPLRDIAVATHYIFLVSLKISVIRYRVSMSQFISEYCMIAVLYVYGHIG